MKRSIIIFLLFYLLGAAFSPALAETSLGKEHSLWLALAEDISETGKGLNEWLPKLPDFDGKGNLFGTGPIGYHTPVFFSISSIANEQTTSSNTVNHRPFYLLFHALVFYETAV